MHTVVSPTTIAPPAARYAHAVTSVDVDQWLHTAGVVPIAADGTVPDGLANQATVVWANLRAILAEADMTAEDVVSVTTYVVAGEDLAPVMAARDQALGGRLVASTLVTVPALARPEWHIEVSLIAAR